MCRPSTTLAVSLTVSGPHRAASTCRSAGSRSPLSISTNIAHLFGRSPGMVTRTAAPDGPVREILSRRRVDQRQAVEGLAYAEVAAGSSANNRYDLGSMARRNCFHRITGWTGTRGLTSPCSSSCDPVDPVKSSPLALRASAACRRYCLTIRKPCVTPPTMYVPTTSPRSLIPNARVADAPGASSVV